MSTAVVPNRLGETSPHRRARITGVGYLLAILTGILAISVNNRLVVSGDAAATATNILVRGETLCPKG
jgi:hypothetical protein